VHAVGDHRAARPREGAIAGRHAVVIGRSDIVGKPMLLLLHRDATVTVCHSRTPNLAEVCRQADILVAAVGKPGLVARVRQPGAAVIDVGMNTVTDRRVAASLFPEGHPVSACSGRRGPYWSRRPSRVAEVAGALTPCPAASDR